MRSVGNKRKISAVALYGCVAAVMFGVGCNEKAPVDKIAEGETIRNLDVEWSKTAATRDVDATVAYYSDDATVSPPNEALATTKAAIRAGWAELLTPGNDISWQPSKVDVASSGDMAYSMGSYTLTMKDAEGKPVTDHGKYTEVWKKQADGKWKTVADMWNSDLPVVAPASSAAPAKGK
jgi:ketosteroid isomerase-like protein